MSAISVCVASIIGAAVFGFAVGYVLRADFREKFLKNPVREIGKVAKSNAVKGEKIYLDVDAIAKIIAKKGTDSATVQRCRKKMYGFGKRVELKKYFNHVQGILYYTEYVMHFQNLEWIELRLYGAVHITCHDDFAIQEYEDAGLIRNAIRKYSEENNLEGYQEAKWEKEVYEKRCDYAETH